MKEENVAAAETRATRRNVCIMNGGCGLSRRSCPWWCLPKGLRARDGRLARGQQAGPARRCPPAATTRSATRESLPRRRRRPLSEPPDPSNEGEERDLPRGRRQAEAGQTRDVPRRHEPASRKGWTARAAHSPTRVTRSFSTRMGNGVQEKPLSRWLRGERPPSPPRAGRTLR